MHCLPGNSPGCSVVSISFYHSASTSPVIYAFVMCQCEIRHTQSLCCKVLTYIRAPTSLLLWWTAACVYMTHAGRFCLIKEGHCLNSLLLVFTGAIDCDLGPWPTLWARPLRARPTASPQPLSIASLGWRCPSPLAACWTETSPPSRTPSVSSSMMWTGTGWR